MILIAVAAALFNNFTSVFQNRQVSEVSFYILYMLLMTLSLVTFQHYVAGYRINCFLI